jgi:hypothetical protein
MLCCYVLQESDEDVEEHYCVVCEKRFRSAGQLANHERSKKHQEAVTELRQLLEEEEQDADWLLVSNGHLCGVPVYWFARDVFAGWVCVLDGHVITHTHTHRHTHTHTHTRTHARTRFDSFQRKKCRTPAGCWWMHVLTDIQHVVDHSATWPDPQLTQSPTKLSAQFPESAALFACHSKSSQQTMLTSS